MALLGLRWVRALYGEREIRDDWEQWLKERRAAYLDELAAADDNKQIRQVQGCLRALNELSLFIELARQELGRPEAFDEPAS